MDELTSYRAKRLLKLGLEAVEKGWLQEARAFFRQSAKTKRSADALTYWGWMEHHLGKTRLAIRLCEGAIQIDPEFGNPYNDIGSYLITLDRSDEAVRWLEKATKAKRYRTRQFPHVNLGRVFFGKRDYFRAFKEIKTALQYAPQDGELKKLLGVIRKKISEDCLKDNPTEPLHQ